MEEAAGSGARIFVSFAGPTYGSKGTVSGLIFVSLNLTFADLETSLSLRQ